MHWLAEVLSDLAGPPTFTWFGPPPTGPNTPFGDPILDVFDSLRLLCFIASAVAVVFAVVLIARERGAVGQRTRLVASTLLVIGAAMTEAYRFGDYANLRLVVAVIASMALAWGNYLGIRYECPPAPRLSDQ
jgi:hypothetical protein